MDFAPDSEWIACVDADILARTRELRENLHRHAELSFEEQQTAAILYDELSRLSLDGLELELDGTHGMVAWVQGREEGRCVAIRAEMDGLPIHERTGLSYASIHPGRMHACGHDGHMAIAIGLIRLLCRNRSRFSGVVKFIFQPGEEEGAGARQVVSAGALRNPDAQAVLALHARPQIPVGTIELDEVPSAAADGFDVTVRGTSSHGAYPHLGRDAVLIAAQIICGLQQQVARRLAPQQTAVVTVGAISGGQARNVIADRVFLQGTIRTRDPGVRKDVIASVERIAEQTARAMGGSATFELLVGYPRVNNHPALMNVFRRVGGRLLGNKAVLESSEATMGADDFSYYLPEQGGVPGCIVRLGIETDQPLHTEGFDFGHESLEPGILLLGNACLAVLRGEGSE